MLRMLNHRWLGVSGWVYLLALTFAVLMYWILPTSSAVRASAGIASSTRRCARMLRFQRASIAQQSSSSDAVTFSTVAHFQITQGWQQH